MTAAEPRYPIAGRRQQRQATPRRPFQVTLSDAERATLRQHAAERGVSLARLLVESALAPGEHRAAAVSDRQRQQLAASNETRHQLAVIAEEVDEIRRLLATIANNVNQLAKVANISGDTSGMRQLAATLAEIEPPLASLRQWSGSRELAELPALLAALQSRSRTLQ